MDSSLWEDLPNECEFRIFFYANDTAGNLNDTSILTLYKDCLPPRIFFNYPQSNYLYGFNSPLFEIEIDEEFLNTIWYQLSNGSHWSYNFTITEMNGKINQANWEFFGDGVLSIIFYANDTFGDVGTNSIIVRKDLHNPIIEIIFPPPGDIYGFNSPNFTISTKEGDQYDINSVWYQLTNGSSWSENFFITELSGKINQTAWDFFGNGTVTLLFFINDTLGEYTMSSNRTVRKDIFLPLITIDLEYLEHYPYCNEPPFFNINYTESNKDKI